MIRQDDLLRSFCRASIYRQDLIHDPENSIERNLNVLTPIDGRIAVEDFLQYFGVCNQALVLDHKPFENALRIGLVGPGTADEIHRNI